MIRIRPVIMKRKSMFGKRANGVQEVRQGVRKIRVQDLRNRELEA
jgi:hypothetical protein